MKQKHEIMINNLNYDLNIIKQVKMINHVLVDFNIN